MQGDGPEWIFDLDYLTNLMNYQPVVVENRANNTTGSKEANDSAGLKTTVNAEHAKKDTTSDQPFILLPLMLVRRQFKNQLLRMIKIFTHSSYDDENWDFQDDMVEGAVADNNNMDTSNVVSSIPTTRVHSFHLKTQIIGDPSSAVQTRSKIEPKKISEALDDESWIEAMQEELLQFKIQKVWVLVDLPYGKKAIGTKWVYRNKKDERGVVMDVKSAFLYGTIEEEVYVSQPPGFVDPKFPNKLGLLVQVNSAMRKLHALSFLGFRLTFQGILRILMHWSSDYAHQDKYVAEILKKFDFENVKTASTPIETQKPLVKDEEPVDAHLYRSMIGSLMYLTASRTDIMFTVCACSRFQFTLKNSHLNAMKRIFRYLKGRPKLGLWYPKESSFDLVAYSDSNYAGANLDRKSTTRGCQFLGKRLISWQCKKQTIVATSTTEAEYVAAAHCCGHVLWIQNQMLDYGFNFMNTQIFIDNESTISIVKNPVYHSKTKHIEIRNHFIRDSYEKKLIQVLKIHTDDNVADLLTKAFDGLRFNFLVVSIGLLNL
ncbi:hypothetical protein Tco_0237767 [Tanacetum coccineum]